MSDVSDPKVSFPTPAVTPRSPARPHTQPLSRWERATLACLSLVQSVVFGWAYVLPWDKFTVFAALCVCSSISHLLLTLTLGFERLRRLQLYIWRANSCIAISFFGWGTWAVSSSSWHLSQLYGGLGHGLSAALAVVWGLLLLVTIPTAAWGFVRTRGYTFRAFLKTALGGLLIGASMGAAPPSPAAVERQEHEWTSLVRNEIAPALKSRPRLAPGALEWSGEIAKRPTTCRVPPDSTATVLGYFRDLTGKLVGHCWQAPTLPELAKEVAAGLSELAAADVLLLDRITNTRALRNYSSLVEPFLLRPGLDGACNGVGCLAPWQLVARDSFTTYAPLPFLSDLKFGVSLQALGKQLGRKREQDSTLVAIATQSLSLDTNGGIIALKRQHPGELDLTPASVSRASERYAAHIVSAQQQSGQFRYTLHPFTGKIDVHNVSIPRQAGTLLVLCELGENTAAVERTIRLGLQLLRGYKRSRSDQWALALDNRQNVVRLGDSALPLVAFAACRHRVGDEFDDAIRGLSNFLLRQQRPDGSFWSSYDWKKKRHLPGAEALFAPGQALLGLTLVDTLVLGQSNETLGSHEMLTTAIQRGMDHVAHRHWDAAIYPFFFLEENWNCLTARAALAHQRNDAYERFCIDYMRFKSRLILDEDSQVDSEFVGGSGFGNIVPPHNTATSGFGEAMAALISIKKARGEDSARDEVVLRKVLQFLLRQQWTPETCFACMPDAVGAMSEQLHSPITRIDFTQHAWAAVGHGARVLGVTKP
jgi:hypothetical protein